MPFQHSPGATPINHNEIDGLIPIHINTQEQLNEWEQQNILQAELWIMKKKKLGLNKILTINFLQDLHKKMFANTWNWAGSFRKTNKNIGIDWIQINENLKILIDDVIYQINKCTFEHDELVARFHHRLVFIHPFINGNGRHARLMADIILMSLNCKRFSWGTVNLAEANKTRSQYITALKKADQGDYKALINFVRS